MYCTQCGKKISDNSKFCSFCGKTLTPPPNTLPNVPTQHPQDALYDVILMNDKRLSRNAISVIKNLHPEYTFFQIANLSANPTKIKSEVSLQEAHTIKTQLEILGASVIIKSSLEQDNLILDQPKNNKAGCVVLIIIVFLIIGMVTCTANLSNKNAEKTAALSAVPHKATMAENAIKIDISADILQHYTAHYPNIQNEYETILNKAATMVAACKECDHILEVAYDDYESTSETLKIYVDCKNGKRVVLSIDDILNGIPINTDMFIKKPASIAETAISSIDDKQNQELTTLYGNVKVEKMKTLLPVAAQMVSRIESCKGVEKVGYEDYESTKDSLVVYVDCKNNKRVLLTLSDIENKKNLTDEDLKPRPHIAPIEDSAIWEYPETVKELKKQGYSKPLKKLGLENIKRSNKLLPLAAKKAARNNRCDKVSYVSVSLDKSTKDNIVYCVIAENNYKYYFTEKELHEKGPVLSEIEKLEPLLSRHELLAEEIIKSKLTHPSTYDKHFFSSSSRTTNSCNEFLIVFSAQNSFGLKLTYEALVQFDKDSKLVGFRMQEKR